MAVVEVNVVVDVGELVVVVEVVTFSTFNELLTRALVPYPVGELLMSN